jgi:hypothetical protein
MASAMNGFITNIMLEEHFGLPDFESVYRKLHRKRMERDYGLDFNDYLVRQYEEEQEARLLMDAHQCVNW